MPKRPKTKRQPASESPSNPSAALLPVDRENVDRLVRITNGAPDKPEKVNVIHVESERTRKIQIMRSFFEGIDFDTLEGDLEQMNELQMIVNRRGDDDASGAVGRVIELLEALQDTGETCGLNSSN